MRGDRSEDWCLCTELGTAFDVDKRNISFPCPEWLTQVGQPNQHHTIRFFNSYSSAWFLAYLYERLLNGSVRLSDGKSKTNNG
jgi:hypothetical protein